MDVYFYIVSHNLGVECMKFSKTANRWSKQVCLGLLISLPFSQSLQAGWLDTLGSSRIGQWFLKQPKAMQIGMGLGTLVAICVGYRYFTQSVEAPVQESFKSIDLNLIDFGQELGEEYRIYSFGQFEDTCEMDINDLASVLSRDDTSVCAMEDKRLMFPEHWEIKKADVAELTTRNYLEGNSQWGRYRLLEEVEVFMMRNKMNQFIGFTLISKQQGHNTKNFTLLFVAPNFRRQGHATKLLAHAYQALKGDGIAMGFYAYKNNPACALYDKLAGFTKTSSHETQWHYESRLA